MIDNLVKIIGNFKMLFLNSFYIPTNKEKLSSDIKNVYKECSSNRALLGVSSQHLRFVCFWLFLFR